MRADARSLLDRLGRSDFAYKEFADRFSDLELWPLFEALLKDPRLYQPELTAVPGVSGEVVAPTSIAAARPAEPTRLAEPLPAPEPMPEPFAARVRSPEPVRAVEAPRAPASESLADLFSRYENDSSVGPEGRTGQDVRAMLRRLSELDKRGEL